MSQFGKNENSPATLDSNGSFSASIQTSVFTISIVQWGALWCYCENIARTEPEHFVQHLLLKNCHVFNRILLEHGPSLHFNAFLYRRVQVNRHLLRSICDSCAIKDWATGEVLGWASSLTSSDWKMSGNLDHFFPRQVIHLWLIRCPKHGVLKN